MEAFDPEFIRKLVKEGRSYQNISDMLKEMHPDTRGLSERSVRRYCNENGISYRSGLNQEELTEAVSRAVSEVSEVLWWLTVIDE